MNFLALLYMTASTFCLSLTGLLSKILSGTLSIEFLTFLRLFIPALILLATVVVSKILVSEMTIYPRYLMKPIIVRALCIVGCQFCFLTSLETLSLVEGVVLFATGPLFIPVLEKLFFKVKIKMETKLSLAVTFIGVFLLAGDVSGIQIKPELLYGLGAGMFNAGSQLSLFRASKGDAALSSINGWTFFISALCLVPVVSFVGLSNVDQVLLFDPLEHIKTWGVITGFSIAVVANQIFRTKAYKLAENNSQIAPLIYISLVFTIIWQYAFFDESYSTNQIGGIVLIVISSLMHNFSSKLWVHLQRKTSHGI